MKTKVVYERELPGGGFVQVEEGEAEGQPETPRASVAVERRRDPARREGHLPPVIAAEEGSAVESLLRRLVEIASDNVEIARRLLRRSGGRARF